MERPGAVAGGFGALFEQTVELVAFPEDGLE
jgi:hypothetical protein